MPTTMVPTVLTADAIAALPVEPLGNLDGVSHRVLWRDATSMSGVLTVQAGHRLGTHAHRLNEHHIWILEGQASILGKTLGEGGYVHVPSELEHDIDATSTGGCTVLYLYLRPAG